MYCMVCRIEERDIYVLLLCNTRMFWFSIFVESPKVNFQNADSLIRFVSVLGMFQATNTKNHSQKYIKLLNMYICMFMHKYTIIRSCVQAMSCDVFSSDHMSQQAKNSPLEYIFVHRIFLPNNVKVRSENRCTRVISSKDFDQLGCPQVLLFRNYEKN